MRPSEVRRGTALRSYARLETTGLWTPAGAEKAQEVLVSLGEATLILSDLSDRPVAHWSLPAVRRVAASPPTYAPGGDGGDALVVEDAEMNRALALVIAAAREPPARRPLRRLTGLLGGALVIGAALWFGPALLRQQAAAALSPGQVVDLGRAVVARLPDARPCADPYGVAAVERLARGALGPDAPPVRVLTPGPTGGAVPVPGAIVLSGGAVAGAATPGELAARLRAASAEMEARPPVEAFLAEAGPLPLVEMLTTARWPEDALRRYADRVAVAEIAPAPESVPVSLSDADWIALKGICAQ